jgi:L-lactate dehydrogenase complex protein LldG
MSAHLSSRQSILDRIRVAVRSNDQQLTSDYAQIERQYVRIGKMEDQARIALLIERLREYDAEVVETSIEGLPAIIEAQLSSSGGRTFAAPDGLPAEWLSGEFVWKLDSQTSDVDLAGADGVMTAAFCGIADSGTIVLHHSATEGRRALTLLPDWHLCVLRSSQVVETLPEYFDRCPLAPTLATFVSGPSATADIEMTRIKGVHGPRFLHVILVRDHDAVTGL